MFKTSLLLAIFVTTSLFAQTSDCLGDLCKGDVVIDSSNYVGVVVGAKDGQVLYRRNGNNYENTASGGLLSEKIASPKFPSNTYIIDASNYVGKVKNAFADGRVEYQREGNNYNNVSNTVVPEVQGIDGVKKDVIVIDSSNYVGKTSRVFSDGRVQYRREGNNYDNISTQLSPEIQEKEGIFKGKKVIDSSNYVGITSKVFKDGRIQYRRAGNNYDNISNSLSPEVSELNNISANKNVMDESNYAGVAMSVFKDGRVEYRREGNNYNNISTNLAYEIPALSNGTKTGTVVLDSSNYVGSAKKVYSDGRTSYQRRGNNYNNVAVNLSYEVETHKDYSKEIEYASPSHTIGEVIRFFSNESIELSGESYNTICDKLFAEAVEVDGVKAGVEVILPMQTAVVEKIFENSTARIQIEGKPKSIQVLKADQIEKSGHRMAWLADLRIKLLSPQFTSASRFAVKKEDYKKLLELLKKDLTESNMGFSKDEKKKVIEYLDGELTNNQ